MADMSLSLLASCMNSTPLWVDGTLTLGEVVWGKEKFSAVAADVVHGPSNQMLAKISEAVLRSSKLGSHAVSKKKIYVHYILQTLAAT